ncbi:hypothetical protein [Microvirga thermotolerans]|uniref:DUF4150 domain-containing protein n=1 Tax=Microvirga thermotolerans TaxID=2651334 RepID=A0A5P9JV44_9HYPH|nr:hypothetical protein [Microvirga thermotolerans]QFU16303.1 hypothetical protein GDR74_08740 [Microvirga thermotolerans]
MRRTILTAALGMFLAGTAGAMAQPYLYPAPVPNASGSQATNPGTYGATAEPGTVVVVPGQGVAVGTCPPPPNASGSLATNPCSYHNMGTAPGMDAMSTGSIVVQPGPMVVPGPVPGPMYVPGPVPNASGSQTTDPATYGDTLPR